ncbi:GAF and ANTAR domain-containing protein [Kitasatospora sp. NBC_01302]|uniref:GAF and ANTAR domain-containing protein n=1 Tax=Kitasatospora sp. NBC_01302 TaxID=2903575 RepID=UPI002E103F15|nr:GAF and ANTAR domain-containing protein [Kitasatospora sp. NBC_01302]
MAEPTARAPGGSDAPVSGAAASRTPADDADLRESLAGLSRLASGQLDLRSLLTHVADFAMHAIPGADGVGLTLVEDGRADTIVSSAAFVRDVDAIQYRIGEGPCITAAAERRTVHSASLGKDPSWPRFGPQVGRLGVHSVLSLPLLTGDQALGAMNVYARGEDVFDAWAVELGELFAVPAAISVENAQALAQAKRLAVQLQSALTHRAVIDQALGILMSRSGCTPAEAFDKLRVMSQSQNLKASAVAQQLLDEAVARAQARHSTG